MIVDAVKSDNSTACASPGAEDLGGEAQLTNFGPLLDRIAAVVGTVWVAAGLGFERAEDLLGLAPDAPRNDREGRTIRRRDRASEHGWAFVRPSAASWAWPGRAR